MDDKTLLRRAAKAADLPQLLRAYKRWVGAEHGLIPVASTDTHPLMAEAADRIEELEAALRPFSFEAGSIDKDEMDDGQRRILVSVGACRRAAAALCGGGNAIE